MTYTSYILRDTFLILGLFIFPVLSKTIPIFSLFDELIFAFMIGVILLRIIYLKYIFTTFDILIFLYFVYSSFLIFFNHIPLTHFMQIFITSKFIFIYLYFNSMNDHYKAELFLHLFKILIIIFSISAILSVLQFLLPGPLNSYSNDGRGLLGITPGGIFWSRTLYPEFLLVFIIFFFSFTHLLKGSFQLFFQFKYYIFILIFILVFLTFARKELLLLTLLTPLLLNDKILASSKPIIYMLMVFSIFMLFILLLSVFADINSNTFTDKQVRFHLFQYAIEIFQYYFPFGSGPGTYGSIMSIQYKDIYEQFDVSSQIVGTDEKRGVIFDLFLISLLAEYGLGWIFFILIIISMIWNKPNPYLIGQLNFTKLKISISIFLMTIAVFVPILLNWVGFVMFTMLALISNKGKYNVHSN